MTPSVPTVFLMFLVHHMELGSRFPLSALRNGRARRLFRLLAPYTVTAGLRVVIRSFYILI